MPAPDLPDLNALKILLISTAREQVEAGAHYLWGAAGNTPGQSDGASFRKDHARLHKHVPDLSLDTLPKPGSSAPHTPMLFAAYCGCQGTLACAGRAAKVNMDLALDISKEKAMKLKLRDLTEEQFEELKTNSANAAGFRWPRPNGTVGTNSHERSTVWAEACTGKRHFDCIGLVNWAFTTVLQRPVQYGISQFKKNLSVGQAEAGDLVTMGAHHIGLVTEQDTVIEAMDIADGVVELPIGKRGWKECTRLPDSFWHFGA